MCASYKRHWECLHNVKPEKFDWKSSEGDDDDSERHKALLQYIE